VSLNVEIASLTPSALIELFVLDLTQIGGDLLRFHAGTNQLGQPVVWQGNTYTPFPVTASGFEFTGRGPIPRPQLIVSNVLGVVTGLVLDFNDMLGAKITRKRTLARYLDAVNFPAGNPTADPDAHLPDEVYTIDRKSSENKVAVQFELAAAFDVAGVLLPRRQIIQNVCQWVYRGAECGYVPGATYNAKDEPVSNPALDQCGKRLTSCKLRFGSNNPLPFGSFPGAGLVR